MGPYVRLLWRYVRQAFHFLIGLAFLGLTAYAAYNALEQWRIHLQTPHDTRQLYWAVICIAFPLVTLGCALYTFLKARSVR
jgi:hypothetical protein